MSYVYSGVTYTDPAPGTTTFALTSDTGNAIEYLSEDHITVKKSTDGGTTWVTLIVVTDYYFNSAGTEIILTTGTTAGDQIRIERHTPVGAEYIVFNDGSLLTSNQLNTAEKFSLYCDQEIIDGNVSFDPADIGLNSTDDLPEGSVNLYYTDARVAAWIAANLASTDDLVEGSTNLYYTDERVDARITSWIGTNLSDTDDLAEGSVNLYYTDARVEAYVSGAGYIKDAGVTKIVAGLNVTISPVNGLGEVTINSVGGGSGGGFQYKGTIDATGSAPGSSESGDLWINTATSGVVGSGWTGIVGDPLTGNERLIYDGSSWSMLTDQGVPEAPDDGSMYARKNEAWESFTIPTQVQSDWNESTTSSAAYIQNKPTIPAAQVQSDWSISDSSNVAFIKNKPTIPTGTPTLQQVCDQGTVTTTKIQAAGFRVDQLSVLP